MSRVSWARIALGLGSVIQILGMPIIVGALKDHEVIDPLLPQADRYGQARESSPDDDDPEAFTGHGLAPVRWEKTACGVLARDDRQRR